MIGGCNGVIQVVLDTVSSVQLKMKKSGGMMVIQDEARERQLLDHEEEQQFADAPNPFKNEITLSTKDWLILALGTVFLLPFRAVGVVLGLVGAWLVAKIGLWGLSQEEVNENTSSRKGWRLKLMHWYRWFGMLIFWAAGFWINVKGTQASRSEAPILVGAPHSSFLEALIIYMLGSSPVSRHENRSAFLISACQLFYQAIFVDR